MSVQDAPTNPNNPPTIDMERLQAFAGQVGGDTAAAAGIAMVELGDRLGFYRAMTGAGPITAEQLASATGCNTRLVGEWLLSQAAAGYITYDPDAETFELGMEEAIVLATDDSPAFMGGAIQIVRSVYLDGDRLANAFLSDGGVGWGDHHECMFHGLGRFLGHTYEAFLVDAWIPQVDGLKEQLDAGGRVLDVGCGTGVALVALAKAFPNSRFVGVDMHEGSIEAARERAIEAGVADRIEWIVGSAADCEPGGLFDAVFFFEALHDMGDPDAAIRCAERNLVDDGAIVAVEINAADTRAEQVADPMARLHFTASTALCTPGAMSQHGPRALGNQVGVALWTEIFAENGFPMVTEIDRTPIVVVLEARR